MSLRASYSHWHSLSSVRRASPFFTAMESQRNQLCTRRSMPGQPAVVRWSLVGCVAQRALVESAGTRREPLAARYQSGAATGDGGTDSQWRTGLGYGQASTAKVQNLPVMEGLPALSPPDRLNTLRHATESSCSTVEQLALQQPRCARSHNRSIVHRSASCPSYYQDPNEATTGTLPRLRMLLPGKLLGFLQVALASHAAS